MDKQSLQEWGWIVIIILLLSILIAFAAPFGRFIVNSVQNLLDGFKQKVEDTTEEFQKPIEDEVLLRLGPGLYETNTTTMIYSWDEMIEMGMINADGSVVDGKEALLDGDLVISPTLTELQMHSYNGCNKLTCVVIPGNIESAGMYAFANCTELSRVVFDQTGSLKTIGQEAFGNCKELKNIAIPSSVTALGKVLFNGCTSLESLYIPANVNSMFVNIAPNCPNLKTLEVDENNSVFHSKNNCIIETTEKRLFIACENSVIPEDGSVTIIGQMAYTGSNIENVVIPEGITSIEYDAFRDCKNLKSISVPSTVTEIEEYILTGTSSLESIVVNPSNAKYSSSGNCLIEKASSTLLAGCINSVIPTDGSVTSIESAAFRNSKIKTVAIPASITVIGMNAFENCSLLETVVFAEGLQTIKMLAFSDCQNLDEVILPSSLTSIEPGAFGSCSNLKSLSVKAGNTTYYSVDNCIIQTGTNALAVACAGSKVPTDGSITSIAMGACYGYPGTTFIVPEGAQSIGVAAFGYSETLETITIPSSVTTLSNNALFGCKSLATINYSGTVAEWNNITLSSGWNTDTGEYTIVCTDGTIAKDGTVTYN